MKRMILLAGIPALSLCGCATSEAGLPLIFGRTQTVGISVAGSVPDQGAHLTIGFTDRNLAIVPTTTPRGEPIRGVATDGFTDAMSVLGQFEASASGGTNVTAGLGTFFSTGMASRYLSEGFSCKLGPTQQACTGAEEETGGSTDNTISPN